MSCYPNNSCNRTVLKSCDNTDSVVYTGENLECTGIEYGDTLTVVLQKLDEKYCEINERLNNCSTTTTTTTNLIPTCPSPLDDFFNSTTITTTTAKHPTSCGSNPILNIFK